MQITLTIYIKQLFSNYYNCFFILINHFYTFAHFNKKQRLIPDDRNFLNDTYII